MTNLSLATASASAAAAALSDGASSVALQYAMPTRVWYGRSHADLIDMGLVRSDEPEKNGTVVYTLPLGWKVVDSGISMFQRRLLDDAGNVRARIFYQPASGSGPEMEIAPSGEDKAYLPSKIWHGASVDDLVAMGLVPTGEVAAAGLNEIRQYVLPLGWKVVESGVSPFQTRLVDALGRVRGKIYSQPGSAGGGMEMELTPVTLH